MVREVDGAVGVPLLRMIACVAVRVRVNRAVWVAGIRERPNYCMNGETCVSPDQAQRAQPGWIVREVNLQSARSPLG